MIINNTHVQGIFIYSQNVEYERGDFVVSGDSIYICTASNPTNLNNLTVIGIDPATDSTGNFKMYPGDKVSTAKEYYDYVNGRLSWEFKNSAQEVELALGMEPGTLPIDNVVTERDALPRSVHEGDVYKVGTPSTGYEYAYIPYHEDKYISGNVLNEILQNTFFGVNEEGIITNYVTSGGIDENGNEILEYSIGGSLANIENGRILDSIIKSPDLNNGMFNVSRTLSEIATLVDRNSEVKSVLVKQYTYIDSDSGNKRIRVQEIIDPVIGSVKYRWAEGSNVNALVYSSTRVYELNEVVFYNRQAWISNYSSNSGHNPGSDGYWKEFKGDWAYNNITGWTSNYENSSRVVARQLNDIRSYYAKKIQELEATRQQLTGTFCNREVDMELVNSEETANGTEYSLEAGVNIRMHSSWQYIRSSEGDLLNTLRISTLSDAISLVSSTSFANTYLNPMAIKVNSVIKIGTVTNYTYSYHVAGDRNGWVHGKTLDELLNDFGVSEFSDIFRTSYEEYETLLSLSPDFPYTVIIKDSVTKDLSVSKLIPVSQEWVIGESLLENSRISEEATEVNYEDILFNEGLIRSSNSLKHVAANQWLVETGCLEGETKGNYCTIAPYMTYVSMFGKPIYFLRQYCSFNVEELNPVSGNRETRDISANPDDPEDINLLNSQDFLNINHAFSSLSESLLGGYSNTKETVWNYLSMGPTVYLTDVKYNVGAIVFDISNPGQLYRCIKTSDTPFPSVDDSTYWYSIGTSLEVDNYIPTFNGIFNESDLPIINSTDNSDITSVPFNPEYFHFDAYIDNDPSTRLGETVPTVSPFRGIFSILYPTSEISNEGRHLSLDGSHEAFDVENTFYSYFDFSSNTCYLMRVNVDENLDNTGIIAEQFLGKLCISIFGEDFSEDNLIKLIGSSIDNVNLGDSISSSLSMDCFNRDYTPELSVFVKLCNRFGEDEYFVETKVYQGIDEYNPVFSNSNILSEIRPENISYNNINNNIINAASRPTWLGLCGLEISDFKGKFIRLISRSGTNSSTDYNYYITDSSLLENFIYRGTDKSSLPGTYYYPNVDSSTDIIFKLGNYFLLTSSSGTLGTQVDPYNDVYNQNPVSEIADTRFNNISTTLPGIITVSSTDDMEQVLSSLFPGFFIIVTDGTNYYKFGRGTITNLGTTIPDRENQASYVNTGSILSNTKKYYFPTTLIKYTVDHPYQREYKFAYNTVLTRRGSDSWVTGEGPLTQTLNILGQDTMAEGLDLTNSEIGLQELMTFRGLSVRVVCKKEINGVVHYYINGNYWTLGDPPTDDSEYPETITSDYVFTSYKDLPDAFSLGKVRARTQEGGDMNWYVVQNTRGWIDINLGEGGQFYDENLGFYVYPWWTTNRNGYINIDEALHDYLHTCFVIHPNDTDKWVGIVYESNKTYYTGDEIIWNSKKWKCLSDCTGEEPVDGSTYWTYSGDPIFDALTYIPSESLLISNVNPTVPFKLVTKVGTEYNYFVAINTRSSDFGTTCIATFLIEIPISGTTMIKTHSLTLDLQVDCQYYIDENTWLSVVSNSNTRRQILVHGGTIRNIYYRYRI